MIIKAEAQSLPESKAGSASDITDNLYGLGNLPLL